MVGHDGWAPKFTLREWKIQAKDQVSVRLSF